MLERFFVGIIAALIAGGITPASAEQGERLNFGVTGSVSAQGSQNPFNLLREAAIQDLALRSGTGPLTEADISEALALADIEVTPSDLIDAGIFRREGQHYVLDFNLFTVQDQILLDQLATQHGRLIADAILSRREEIDAALSPYPITLVDPDVLAYILVGCLSLDWDGLIITEEQGYRATARTHGNGGQYVLWAKESDPEISLRGYYWGSTNDFGPELATTSFGDHHSPRYGVPEVTFDYFSHLYRSENTPEPSRAKIGRYVHARISSMNDDLATVMIALREGPGSVETIHGRILDPQGSVTHALNLLVSLGYVQEEEDIFTATAPVFSMADEQMIGEVRAILTQIINDWLESHYTELRNATADLTAVRNGVPYEQVFSQVWHYVFGAANRTLVDEGYFVDPYAEDTQHQGYVSFFWDVRLHPWATR